jgi:long-chain acyl-CoA synthetase
VNRSTALFDWAISQPDKDCVVTDARRYSFAEVCAGIRAAATLLADRVVPGTRVGLFIDSTPNFVLYEYAVFYLGGVVTPINRALKEDEVRRLVRRLEIPLVIADTRLDLTPDAATHRVTGEFDVPSEPGTVEPADAGLDDPALLLQTSGSTGEPKGVVLAQRNLLANYDPSYRWIGVGRDDTILLTLPIFNTYALNQGINMMAMSGATMRLLRRFSPEAVAAALDADRPTFVPLVPTMLNRLRRAGIRHEAPTRVGIGAAPSPAQIVSDAAAAGSPSSTASATSSSGAVRTSTPARSNAS